MQVSQLDKTFFALSDPTRRAMLARLAEGEALLKDLAEPFDMTLPAVSKHLKVLEDAGLVKRTREAQRKPATLDPKPLEEAADWLEKYRAIWAGKFDRLEGLLDEMKKIRSEEKKK